MSDLRFIARAFLIGGGALVAIGLTLWLALPIASAFPPYLVTGLLALGYGTACCRPGLFFRLRKS
jgi:hypothetical protein